MASFGSKATIPDEVVGWTRDGKDVLFRSGRNSYSFGFHRLFTIPLTGGLASEVPLPRAEEGSYSPDGSHTAESTQVRRNPCCMEIVSGPNYFRGIVSLRALAPSITGR
jgi:hypothetical protein